MFVLLCALLLNHPLDNNSQDLSDGANSRDDNNSNRDLLASSSLSSLSLSSGSGHMRAKGDVHPGVGGLRVIPMPQQGQAQAQGAGQEQHPFVGLAQGSGGLRSPLDDQQQRKLVNSQSSNANERIDDGGDDEVRVCPSFDLLSCFFACLLDGLPIFGYLFAFDCLTNRSYSITIIPVSCSSGGPIMTWFTPMLLLIVIEMSFV